MNKKIQNASQQQNQEQHTEEGYSELLADLLKLLPIKYRAPILLRYKEDMSFTEIAEILGIKPVTIRSHISRGLKYLRQQFEKQKITITIFGLLKLIGNIKVEAANPAILQKCLAKQIRSQSVRLASKTKATSLLTPANLLISISAAGLLAYGIIQNTEKPVATPVTQEIINKPTEASLPNKIQNNTAPKQENIYKSWDFAKEDGSDLTVLQGDFKHNKKTGQYQIIGKERGTIVFPLKYQKPILVKISGSFKAYKGAETMSIYVYPAKNPKNVNGKTIYTDDLEITDRLLRSKPQFEILILNTYVILTNTTFDGIAVSKIYEPMQGNQYLANIENLHLHQISFQKITPLHLEKISKVIQTKKIDKNTKGEIQSELNDIIKNLNDNPE